MKNSIKLMSLIIITVGFSFFGFHSEEDSVNKNDKNERSIIFYPINPESKYLNFCFFGADKLSVEEDLMYNVRGRYKRPITIGDIKKAELISDIIEDFPSNWIDDFVSIGISIVGDRMNKSAMSNNDTLSQEQKSMFNYAEINSDIIINVIYKVKNSVTNHLDNRQMNVSMTVVPEMEATYIGGNKKMINYLKENSKASFTEKDLMRIQQAIFLFTVNEAGTIENILIDKSSGNTKIDDLFVDLLKKMPKWKPAENANGSKVKQKFVFRLGRNGC